MTDLPQGQNAGIEKPEIPSDLEKALGKFIPDKENWDKVIALFSKTLISFSIETIQKYSAPLPPPEMLQKFNEVLPGLAERIVKMAENQSNHRIEIEKKAIVGQVDQSANGQRYALFLGGLALIIALVLGLTGHDSVAIAIGSIDIVGLVAAFTFGQRKQRRDLDKKSK